MILETIGRDCLFLNWALPVEGLPELEAPLRYDVHDWQGTDYVFLSAALFRQQVIDIPKVIFPRVSYPQLSVRLCVHDGDGVPSFFISTILLPAWVLPSVRLVARQQAQKASFHYPSEAVLAETPLRWSVRSKGQLEVSVSAGAAAAGEGPALGDWEQTVTYFLRRKRWYFTSAHGLRKIEVTSRAMQAIPIATEVQDHSLLSSGLEVSGAPSWPALHSCWLCPEVPFVFEIGWAKDRPLPRHVPAPG